ncbi:MAG TPA: hypothetical protein VMP41_07155 [Acidimicrobiales bacterium]|nr:hypothetical protein [Acidimicrobiales bacterium]
MPRRNLVPLLLLAVLAVLTAGFAVWGFTLAPTATTIQVQNATQKTFGTPTGANSWIMELVTSVNVGVGTANGTTERLIEYAAPNRMVVYNVSGSSAKIAGVLGPSDISCVLKSYSAMLQGDASWNQKGGTFTRTESLADYTARVPQKSAGGACVPVTSTTGGQVHETAILRSDYLIASRAQVVVPTHGTQGETLVFVRIGKVSVRTLK